MMLLSKAPGRLAMLGPAMACAQGGGGSSESAVAAAVQGRRRHACGRSQQALAPHC